MPFFPIIVPSLMRSENRKGESENNQQSGSGNFKESDVNIFGSFLFNGKTVQFNFSPEFFIDQPGTCLEQIKSQIDSLMK